MSLPSQIGAYRVVRELGRGGMGVVYEGQGPAGQVAIKVLLDPDTSPERFLEEARACARLDHPHLVRLIDQGSAQGHPYLVMPFLEGDTLEARLRQAGPLDPQDATALVATLARALDHVHTQGLLHRDIKPANVLLTAQGPVLTDFGLARDEARDRTRLTQTGMMLGTPGFMSPEQAAGEVQRVGPATDIYGLGALLYAALTGSPPFVGSVVQVLKQVLSDTPAPPSRRASGP